MKHRISEAEPFHSPFSYDGSYTWMMLERYKRSRSKVCREAIWEIHRNREDIPKQFVPNTSLRQNRTLPMEHMRTEVKLSRFCFLKGSRIWVKGSIFKVRNLGSQVASSLEMPCNSLLYDKCYCCLAATII